MNHYYRHPPAGEGHAQRSSSLQKSASFGSVAALYDHSGPLCGKVAQMSLKQCRLSNVNKRRRAHTAIFVEGIYPAGRITGRERTYAGLACADCADMAVGKKRAYPHQQPQMSGRFARFSRQAIEPRIAVISVVSFGYDLCNEIIAERGVHAETTLVALAHKKALQAAHGVHCCPAPSFLRRQHPLPATAQTIAARMAR